MGFGLAYLLNAERIPEPTITNNNPKTLTNVIDSPKKNPIKAAMAMLPPIIIGVRPQKQKVQNHMPLKQSNLSLKHILLQGQQIIFLLDLKIM